MRLTASLLPAFLLAVLPLWAVWCGWGTLRVILALIGIAVVRQIVVLLPVFTKKNQLDDKIILETHALSPFVEKVRWCLDYTGVPYEEEMDLGSLGILLSGRRVPSLRIPGKNIVIQNSSDILRYLYGIHDGKDEKIAKFLEPTPESRKLEVKLDKMGLDIKAIFYPSLFKHPNLAELMPIVLGIRQRKVPSWQKVLFKAILPVLATTILKRNDITKEAEEEAWKSTLSTLDEVCFLLSDGRRYLMGGDQPTFVDFHFAAMAFAFALNDDLLYGGRAIDPESRIPVLETYEASTVAEIRRMLKGREAAVEFAERMYKEHRMEPMK